MKALASLKCLTLPELLQCISSELTSSSDQSALARSCRELYFKMMPIRVRSVTLILDDVYSFADFLHGSTIASENCRHLEVTSISYRNWGDVTQRTPAELDRVLDILFLILKRLSLHKSLVRFSWNTWETNVTACSSSKFWETLERCGDTLKEILLYNLPDDFLVCTPALMTSTHATHELT